MAILKTALMRLADIGKGLKQNTITMLVDVLLSTTTGNGLFYDASNALCCPPGQRVYSNLFRNASFNINQRKVSGTVTLGAYQYGHDGLIAAANGATYTFALGTNGVDTVITITAGQLVLPVAPELIDGSTLHLNYTGTAGFRVAINSTVNQGGSITSGTAWFTRPTAGYVFTPSPGVQVNIMFGDPTNNNNSVKFTLPQLEKYIPYVTPTAFERLDPALEMLKCQRYLCFVGGGEPYLQFGIGSYGSPTFVAIDLYGLMVPLRSSSPTLQYSGSFVVAGPGNQINVSSMSINQTDGKICSLTINTSGAVDNLYFLQANADSTAYIALSAELT